MKKFWENHMWTILVGGVFSILLAAAIYGAVKDNNKTTSNEASTSSSFPTSTTKTFKEAEQPSLGDAEAPHTITVFYDYLCPHCAQWETQVFPNVQKELIESKQARIVFVNYAFLDFASNNAAVAAEYMHKNHPDAFLKFHNSLFANSATLTVDNIVKIAKKTEAAVEEEKLKTAITTHAFADDVLSDKLYAKQKNVEGTPTILVDGKKLNDSSFEAIQAAVK